MDDKVQKVIKKHTENYKNALLQTVDDNTDSLLEEIKVILKEPPLASMDLIKSKILNFAKTNQVIISLEKLQQLTETYRYNLLSDLDCLGSFRKEQLKALIESNFKENGGLIEILETEYKKINNAFIEQLSKNINDNINKIVIPKIVDLVDKNKNKEESAINSFEEEVRCYLINDYPKYILEQIKKLIFTKNHTLNNRFKDQANRIKFIEQNSRLLQEKED